MPYRRRRFTRRRGRKYSTNPFRRLRRTYKRRRSTIKRGILSNRRSIKNLQRAQEVKFISKWSFPNSSGDIPPQNPTQPGDPNYYAHGYSGIESGDHLIQIDKTGNFTIPATSVSGVFNPGLVTTAAGLGGQDNPGGPPSSLWAQGTRVGRWITMKTLTVKYQVSIEERSCTGYTSPLQMVLMLVLDKRPGLRMDDDADSDVNFQWHDMKVNYSKANDANLIQQPDMMEYKTLDPALRNRFHVLARQVRTVQYNQKARLPLNVDNQGVFGAPGSLAVAAPGTAPFTPIQQSGKENVAEYVTYGTFHLKRRFRFDFGPISRLASGTSGCLPINQQIRLVAYVRTVGVQGEAGEQLNTKLNLAYSGKLRFVDS